MSNFINLVQMLLGLELKSGPVFFLKQSGICIKYYY